MKHSTLAYLRGHHFLADGLGANSTVVDLGAHKGEFSSEVVRQWGCECIAVEPVLSLCEQIPSNARIKVVHGAVADADQPTLLYTNQNPEANSLVPGFEGAHAVPITVPGITWQGLVKQFDIHEVALLKVDIEGAEIQLLNGMSTAELARIGQISVEFHDFMRACTTADVEKAISRLARCGFWAIRFSRGFGDVLLINLRVIHLSIVERLLLWHERNVRGLQRIVGRVLRVRSQHP